MTPEERAEKIVDDWKKKWGPQNGRTFLEVVIAAEIRAAEEEAVKPHLDQDRWWTHEMVRVKDEAYEQGIKEGQSSCCHQCLKAQEEVRAEAYEDAAKVADVYAANWNGGTDHESVVWNGAKRDAFIQAAGAIRARAKEVLK